MGTHICTTVFTVVAMVVTLDPVTLVMDTVVTLVPIPMEPILMVPELGTTEDILVTDLVLDTVVTLVPIPMEPELGTTAFLAYPFQLPQLKLHLLKLHPLLKKRSLPRNNYRSENREDILLA